MDRVTKSHSRLSSFVQFLVSIEEGIVFITMTIVLLGIGYGILHRYYATGAIIGLEEICVLAGTWMYFLGACINTHQETHIKGDLISLFLSNKRIKRYLDIIIKISIVLLLVFVSFKVYQYMDQVVSIGVKTTGLKMPKVWFLSSMFAGFILMIFHELVGIIRLIRKE